MYREAEFNRTDGHTVGVRMGVNLNIPGYKSKMSTGTIPFSSALHLLVDAFSDTDGVSGYGQQCSTPDNDV